MTLKYPIGIDDFAKVIEGDFVYVDKTALVAEVLEQPAEVLLITRPRRFGKTLNMSMLAHFFDHRLQSAPLFRNLAVANSPHFARQGSAPVLFLSFKNLKADSFNLFLALFGEMITQLARAHDYLHPHLSKWDQADFSRLAAGEHTQAGLIVALEQLMKWLHQYHGKKVVLLIDEYDSPIHEAFAAGYYDRIITFMRTTMGRALKSNFYLEKALLTGILRVAKESIFSDLNNVDVMTVLDESFSDKFGFTESETTQLLHRAGLSERLADIRFWYNGYRIGNTVIYNPWSLLKFLNNPGRGCRPYWVNTSANLLVEDQLLNARTETQDTLKSLLAGSSVETHVDEQTVFRDLQHNERTLWSFLLFSGYLTAVGKTEKGNRDFYTLAVPNEEVMLLFRDVIQRFLVTQIGETKTQGLLDALIGGDTPRFETYLSELVGAILSYYDTGGKTPERVYHTFVLGLLAHLGERYTIRSNREAGMGRYDVMMLPKDTADRGIIMEFKATGNPEELDACLEAAAAQITARNDALELKEAGVRHYSEIAVASCGKRVAVQARHIAEDRP